MQSVEEEAFPAPPPPIAQEGANSEETDSTGPVSQCPIPESATETAQDEEADADKKPVKKFQRGKRSTIRRKNTQEDIQAEPEASESNEKKMTRKTGSTLRRKLLFKKSSSRTSMTSNSSQKSEIGPDGIHYKPGHV